MVLKKRLLALTLVGAMVLGSSITAFAEDATSATGTGVNTGHLNTEIVTAVLPTSESVATIFNFTIDPEDILASADKFTDGTTAAGAAFKNADLVYFKQANGAEKTYASSSQTVKVSAQNYIDADVSVAATIAAPAEGKTIIPMAESAEAFAEATEATLLLQLKVGDSTGVITKDGATVTDTIDAQPTKFDTTYDGAGKPYKLVAKDNQTWDGKDVQLIGKVKKGTVTDAIVAPNVTLTWTVAKHNDAPTASATSITPTSDVTFTIPSGVTITSVTKKKGDGTFNTLPEAYYTLTDVSGGKKLSITASLLSDFVAATQIKVTFSDQTVITLSVAAE